MIRLISSLSLLLALLLCNSTQAAKDLLQLYRHLHQNPELSFLEKKTAARIAKELRSLNMTVTEQVGGTGVVGVFKNGIGPTVMIRTDLDALPIKEETGLNFASTKTQKDINGQILPTMHACGHDIHMTVFIGTAEKLIKHKNQWQGTLVMIGQPAEERGGGARDMLNDGLFKRFPRPDYNLALHVSSDLPAGSLGLVSGYAMANVDSVDIHVKGLGGHGAYPQKTIDPVVIAADIITSLQTIVSRELSPLDPAVVTVGAINGGTKHNIIPDKVHLQLTVRSYTNQARNTLLTGIERISHGIARAHRVPEDDLPAVVVQDEFTPALYNHPKLVQQLQAVFVKLVGADKVHELKPEMIGEDFSRYGQIAPKIPSTMFRLGSVAKKDYAEFKAGKRSLPTLHSKDYAPDAEPTIKTGVEAMVGAALAVFKNQPSS